MTVAASLSKLLLLRQICVGFSTVIADINSFFKTMEGKEEKGKERRKSLYD